MTDTPPKIGAGSNVVTEYLRRMEKIAAEQKDLAEEMRDLKKEGKSNGVNMKAIAAIVKQQSEDAAAKARREEYENDLDTYKVALGMVA